MGQRTQANECMHTWQTWYGAVEPQTLCHLEAESELSKRDNYRSLKASIARCLRK
jgi:hypothetical protein